MKKKTKIITTAEEIIGIIIAAKSRQTVRKHLINKTKR